MHKHKQNISIPGLQNLRDGRASYNKQSLFKNQLISSNTYIFFNKQGTSLRYEL